MPVFDWLMQKLKPAEARPLPAGRGALQAVDARSPIISASEQAALDKRRFACACAVIVDNQGHGTGLLVGADLVLTNYHVVADEQGNLRDPSLIQCRFGFFAPGEYDEGRHDWIGLATERTAIPVFSSFARGDRSLRLEQADYRDAAGAYVYDYALLRLRDPVGNRQGRGPNGESINPLGWIKMDPNRSLPQVGQPLWIIEFPERVGTGPRPFAQEEMRAAHGQLEMMIADGLRARHNASTRPGSSGSGVFDSQAGLIGLHNAGEERPDKTADNRFIPLPLILEDIKRQDPELHDELVAANPPPVTISGLSRQLNDAIRIRVEAAKTVVDRDRENARIIAAFGAQSDPPVRVNHLVARRDQDQIDYFIQRLTISAAHLENLRVADLTGDFLRGRAVKPGAFVPWEEISISWPEPKTPLDQARTDMDNQLLSLDVRPRTLLVIRVSDLDMRDPAEEVDYMRLLGEALWSHAARSAAGAPQNRMFQAVVVYEVFPDIEVDPARFTPLWNTPPPHCGVSIALPKVQRNDVEPWVKLVNSCWSTSGEKLALPNEFRPGQQLSMSEVFGLLDRPITKAAIALVARSLEEKR